MGSLPDSKYIIQTDGYWFVEAHDVDPSKGYITVSAKGVINGLSNQPNDGADFGPDTYNPNHTGSGIPYTQTSGIQEAWNLAVSAGVYITDLNGYFIPAIKLLSGMLEVTAPITMNSGGKRIMNPHIYGDSSMSPYISAKFNSGYLFTLDASSFNFSNIEFSRIQPYVPPGYTPTGIINADFSAVNPRSNLFISYEFNISNTGWTGAPFNLVSFDDIVFYDLNDYSNTVSVYNASQTIQFFGGVIYGINAQSGSVASNSVELTIVGARYTVIQIGTGLDLYLIGGRATGFSGMPSQITLNGNVNNVYINSKILGPASSFITGAYTIEKLIATGTYGNEYMSGTSNFVDSGTTVNYSNVQMINVSPATLILPTAVGATTPSVPTSGTAQQNTNPYPVNVYIYGGTVTVIDYTPNGGSATQVGTAGPATVRLNPGDSITLTYSGTPTWNWVAV